MNKEDKVLQVMQTREDSWYVDDLAEATGLHPGELYMSLARLEATRKVKSKWDDPDADYSRRRMYGVAGPPRRDLVALIVTAEVYIKEWEAEYGRKYDPEDVLEYVREKLLDGRPVITGCMNPDLQVRFRRQ